MIGIMISIYNIQHIALWCNDLSNLCTFVHFSAGQVFTFEHEPTISIDEGGSYLCATFHENEYRINDMSTLCVRYSTPG